MTVNKSPTVPMDWKIRENLQDWLSDSPTWNVGVKTIVVPGKKKPLTIAILHDPIRFGRNQLACAETQQRCRAERQRCTGQQQDMSAVEKDLRNEDQALQVLRILWWEWRWQLRWLFIFFGCEGEVVHWTIGWERGVFVAEYGWWCCKMGMGQN